MGCWMETCFLTRAPIFYGEEVYMIVLKEGTTQDHLFMYPHLNNRVKVFKGNYDSYGWLEGLDGAYSPDMNERTKGNKEAYELSIFAHKEAWKTVLESGPNALDLRCLEQLRESVNGEQQEILEQFCRVLTFCYSCRLDPLAGLTFKGSQTEDIDRYKILIQMMQFRESIWQKNIDENTEE
jgi:hypothetical protein